MKYFICLFAFTTLTIYRGNTQNFTDQFPQWRAAVKVIDENGQPVSDADVAVDYGLPPSPGHESEYLSKLGKTDTNGVFAASGRTTSVSLGFRAVKDGFYKTQIEHELGSYLNYDPVALNPSVTLILKKIGQPVPMYAMSVNLGMPATDKALGFDLVVGDWVGPYGKGISPDMIFTKSHSERSAQDYDDKLTVSFPNNGDGIQGFDVPFKLTQGSALRSPHEAPESGFEPQLVKTTASHPDSPDISNYDSRTNYFFRIRTVLDEKGGVKSALYGKIYGDFLQFTYYLNPTPNSRNMEFDTHRNLLKGKDRYDSKTGFRRVNVVMP